MHHVHFSRPHLSNGRAIGMIVVRRLYAVCGECTLANGEFFYTDN